MSHEYAMKLFRSKCEEIGQAEVAKTLKVSPSAVNQLYRGNYKAAPDAILQRVRESFGTETLYCTTLGEISLGRCAEEKKKPYAPLNSDYVRQRKACRTCKQGGKP